MPAPFRALLGAAVLAAAGFAVPAGTAAADTDCAPVLDPASVSYTPLTLAITSKGYKTQQAAGSVTAPCARANGSDLQLEVILSPADDLDGTLGIDDDAAAYPSTGGHSYGLFTEYEVHSGDLRNADAGTWTTELIVTDSDDDSAHSYDSVDGPSITIVRAAKVTAKAPASVKHGKLVKVKGKLTRANWDTRKDGAYAKQKVQLQFRAEGDSAYTTLTTVKSSSKGKVKAKVKATTDGSYRFVFAGSSSTAKATSAGDDVHVK